MICVIGIDPGVTTGVALVDHAGGLVDVRSCGIIEAMEVILEHKQTAVVVFEDAAQRTWFGNKGREALQGAGSIKRSCSVLREFLTRHSILFRAVRPQRGLTKWTSAQFAKLTGWQGRTNEHARDAACLVYGLTRERVLAMPSTAGKASRGAGRRWRSRTD